jgi:1,4-alpha-glucan branching enzyme
MGICLTAPGIPMIFMGQEFLENKLWSDNQTQTEHLIYWEGLNSQKQMSDFLRFTRELIALRWQYPGLRGQGFSTTHVNNKGRVLAFHRWIPGEGKDVMVVVSLSNSNTYNYRVGFPSGGSWKEAFNSDIYENWVNPNICGNGGWVNTDNQSYDGFNYSVAISVPANGILVFIK